MQTIQIKIEDSNFEFFIELIKKLNIVKEIKVGEIVDIQSDDESTSLIQSPQGIPSIDDFKGFWLKNPKTLEQIREKAWKRI